PADFPPQSFFALVSQECSKLRDEQQEAAAERGADGMAGLPSRTSTSTSALSAFKLDSPPDSDRNSWGSGSPTHSAASLSPGGCNGVLRGAPPPVSLVSAPPLPPPQIQQGSGVGHASGQTVSLKGLGDLVAHASPLSSRGVPGASPRWGVSQTMGSLPSPSGLIDNPAQIWQDITSLGEEFDVEAWCKHARESGRHQGEQIAELAGVILRLQKAVLFLANNARGQGSAGPASIGGSRTSMASVASAGGVGTGSERLRWSRSQGLP
ncbi:unnamed protein product, partial [Polarella glacialis]